MTRILIVISVILATVKVTGAVHCLSCFGVTSPIHCHRIRNCPIGQICFTEKYTNINGETLYNVGCQDGSVCSKRNTIGDQGSIDPSRNVSCANCCESDICNSGGCGSSGYPMDRGPICYSCAQTRDPHLCSFIEGCDKNDVCYIEAVNDFGETIYTSSCRQAKVCGYHGNPNAGQVVGKRAALNSSCCQEDLCNSQYIAVIQQWVETVTNFSSQYNDNSWSANQVIGIPNVYPRYGDIVGSWAQGITDANQFIEVSFNVPVFVTGLEIYETFNAGGITAIKAKDDTDTWRTLWQTDNVTVVTTARIFAPDLTVFGSKTRDIRIEIDCTASHSWVEIDAIQLTGTV